MSAWLTFKLHGVRHWGWRLKLAPGRYETDGRRLWRLPRPTKASEPEVLFEVLCACGRSPERHKATSACPIDDDVVSFEGPPITYHHPTEFGGTR